MHGSAWTANASGKCLVALPLAQRHLSRGKLTASILSVVSFEHPHPFDPDNIICWGIGIVLGPFQQDMGARQSGALRELVTNPCSGSIFHLFAYHQHRYVVWDV